MFLIDAVEDFMVKALRAGIAGSADEVFAGRNKELFIGELRKRLHQYTPSPLKRSYGGSQLGLS
jgi:hypothetical protein